MEPYVQAIIAIVVILVFALLFWLCCIRRSGLIEKRYVKVREPADFDTKYNLQNLVRLMCNIRIKRGFVLILFRPCK